MIKNILFNFIFYFIILFDFCKNLKFIKKENQSKELKSFEKFNKTKNRNLNIFQPSKIIFIDIFKVPHHIYLNSSITKYLSQEYNYEVSTYNTSPRTDYDHIYNSLKIKHKIIKLKYDKIKLIKKYFLDFFLKKKQKNNCLITKLVT